MALEIHDKRLEILRYDEIPLKILSTPEGPRELRNPTTAEASYDEEQFEFLKAIDSYRQRTHKPLLTIKDAFRVALAMGYRRVEDSQDLPKFFKGKCAVLQDLTGEQKLLEAVKQVGARATKSKSETESKSARKRKGK